MKTLKKILIFVLKIVILSLKLVVYIMIKAETYALALVMFPLVICIIICILGSMWLQLKIFGIIAAAIFVVLITTSFLQVWVELLEERLKV
jgi:hypothetical protein